MAGAGNKYVHYSDEVRAGLLILSILGLYTLSESQSVVTRSGAYIGSTVPSAPAAPSFSYTATLFNGTDNTLTRGGDFSGSSDSKLLTVSLWFKLNGQDNALRTVMRGGAQTPYIYFETDNTLHIKCEDNTFSYVLDAQLTATTYTSSSTWHHLALSVDLSDNSKRSVYIDGSVQSPTWSTYVNGNMYFANGGDIGIAGLGNNTGWTSISFSEVWIAYGQYLDLSSNISKFISGGKPVNLGSDGSTPTGSQPTVYLHNGFATFQNNLGTGGNFTANGTLANDPSIP